MSMPSRNRLRTRAGYLATVGLLVALGTVLNLAEIPLPRMVFPWAKPGLANQATLLGIMLLGPGAGLTVAVLRSVLSNLILGLLLTPGFVLSVSGSVASAAAMGIFYRVFWVEDGPVCGSSGGEAHVCRRVGERFSIISISVIGALVHNAVQLFAAYILLVQHWGIWLNLPPMIVVGVVTGLFNGCIASLLLRVVFNKGPQKG